MNGTHAITAAEFDAAIAIVMERPSDEPLTLAEVREIRTVLDAGRRLVSAEAKTHDLSVRRTRGGAVIEVSNETDDYTVYLIDGAAHDLGRVLAVLTPAQRQLLIDELTGGEK